MYQDNRRPPWKQFAEGFEEVERSMHFVQPDSRLGQAMAGAREAWTRDGLPDPDNFHVTPEPGDPDRE